MLSRAGERLCRQGVTQYIGLAINNECILHCQVLYSLLSSSRDPFVLESNPSGHPSSVSGDPIARCKRWIEREILKPSVLIDCQLDGYQTIIIMSRSCQKLLVSPLKTSQSLSAFDTNCWAFVIISQPFRVHFCNMQQAKSLYFFFSLFGSCNSSLCPKQRVLSIENQKVLLINNGGNSIDVLFWSCAPR